METEANTKDSYLFYHHFLAKWAIDRLWKKEYQGLRESTYGDLE
jgi:hypothetical protein